MRSRVLLILVIVSIQFVATDAAKKKKKDKNDNDGYSIDSGPADSEFESSMDWFLELQGSLADIQDDEINEQGQWSKVSDDNWNTWDSRPAQAPGYWSSWDQESEDIIDWSSDGGGFWSTWDNDQDPQSKPGSDSWGHWGDFDSFWTDIEWSLWDAVQEWSYGLSNTVTPQPPGYFTMKPPPPATEEPPVFIDIDQYWSGDVYTDWCKDTWISQPISEDWQNAIDEFKRSGNITNWCVYPGQVMLVSDLSNINLNDPYALPTIFDHELWYYCNEQTCQRHLEKRKMLRPDRLVERTWRYMEIYRRIDCRSCFCSSDSKKKLDEVMGITKDHLKKNEFLSYIVTPETPKEVEIYFNRLKVTLGLENEELSAENKYNPLLTMKQAIEGPGKDAITITEYTELTHALYHYCDE